MPTMQARPLVIGERMHLAPRWRDDAIERFAARGSTRSLAWLLEVNRTAFTRGVTSLRLCEVMDLDRDEFDALNLLSPSRVPGEWDAHEAREVARAVFPAIWERWTHVILLGAKVSRACARGFAPFAELQPGVLCLPHPSGLCRLWNEAGSVARARAATVGFLAGPGRAPGTRPLGPATGTGLFDRPEATGPGNGLPGPRTKPTYTGD